MTEQSGKYEVAKSEKPSLLVAMAAKANLEPGKFLDTIKATVLPSKTPVSNEQLIAFLSVANRYNLDPFRKELYAFPDKRGGIIPVVGVDGAHKLIRDSLGADFGGIEYEEHADDDGNPIAVTCRVYSRAIPERPACTITERFKECFRNTDPWKSHPWRMLRHKATHQAARALVVSGVFDQDEAESIAEATVVSVKPTDDPLKPGRHTTRKPKVETPPAEQQEVPDDVPPDPEQSQEIDLRAAIDRALTEKHGKAGAGRAKALIQATCGDFDTLDEIPDDRLNDVMAAICG